MKVAAFVLTLLLGVSFAGHAQTPPDLRQRLTARFDVVPLQQGVAIVPRDSASRVRLVQVVDGVVTVDGETLTGAQLRTRLGNDADLILQVSYLDREAQRALASGGGGTTVDAPAAPQAPSIPPVVERHDVRRGDIIRFGDAVKVERHERVEGDVIVFGDSATIDGEVTGDVTVFGDTLRLGPDAVVRGDVNAIGGNLDRAPGSQVLGEVNEVVRGRGRIHRGTDVPGMLFGGFWSRVFGLGATVLRLTVLLLIGLIVLAFGRNAVESIGARTATAPVRVGLIGLAGEILFLPVLVLTIVVLAVSIVGIPLLVLVPFAVLFLMLIGLMGLVGVAYQIGNHVGGRIGLAAPGPYLAVALGMLALGSITIIGKLAGLAGGVLLGAPLTGIGYFIEYIAWTVGFGAALLYWYEMQPGFGHRRKVATAPVSPPPEG